MFHRKTLFVVGAGASAEIDLPIGGGLAAMIEGKMDIRFEMGRRIASSDGARVTDPGIGLTIEHILPKNPGPEWDDVVSNDLEVLEDCVYRLGNLCLLGKLNKEVGRKSFSKKKTEYGKTDILTTQSLINFTKWTRQQIDQRQAAMAKRAAAIWRF